MGLLRNILGMFDKKVMAIEVIDRQKKVFYRYKARYPNKHLHYWLANTRLSRIAGLNFRAGEDPQMVMRAAAETLMLACMPEEKAVRALGLYTLHFERPDIIHESPELNTELVELLKPVNASMNNGTQENLYRIYNPKKYGIYNPKFPEVNIFDEEVDLFDEAILFCIEKWM